MSFTESDASQKQKENKPCWRWVT